MFEVLLAVDHKPLGIPYLRPPDDASSSSYVDLKENPAGIATIPELNTWPELKKTVETINQTISFKTLGCAEFVYENKSPNLRIHAYIDFCFADIIRNEDQLNLYDLFHRFTEYVATVKPSEGLVIRIEMRRTAFYKENIAGWCLEYWVLGLGDTQDNARQVPNEGFKILEDFIRIEETHIPSEATNP
jgi:hypothetical protein